jgi:hypothetical protein
LYFILHTSRIPLTVPMKRTWNVVLQARAVREWVVHDGDESQIPSLSEMGRTPSSRKFG